MAAVLQAALDDVRNGAARTGAIAWVQSTDRLWPFSFENLCDALDMDAGDVRRQLTIQSIHGDEALSMSTAIGVVAVGVDTGGR